MLVLYLSTSVFAQDAHNQDPSHTAQQGNAAKVREMQRIIEEQQRQLDAHQDQLAAQEKKLQELRQQVQGLAEGPAPPKAPVAETFTARPSGGASPRRTDTQTRKRDKAHPNAYKATPTDDIPVNGFFWRFNQHTARPADASGLRGT